jgi:hypothetical protein
MLAAALGNPGKYWKILEIPGISGTYAQIPAKKA